MWMKKSSAGFLWRAGCVITFMLALALPGVSVMAASGASPQAPVANVSGRLTDDAVLSRFEIDGTKYCVEVKLAAIARLTPQWQDYPVTVPATNACEQALGWYVAPNRGLPDRPVSFFECDTVAGASSCVRITTPHRILIGVPCVQPVMGVVRGEQWMRVGTYEGRDGFALCEYH